MENWRLIVKWIKFHSLASRTYVNLQRMRGYILFQVTREMHSYVGNIEEREEGGTPAIIESIRAGIVFKLKEVQVRIKTRAISFLWKKRQST